MRRMLATSVLVAGVFLQPQGVAAQQARAGQASGQAALDYVRALAADGFEGRKAGLPGGIRSGQWIADRFKEWGLQPAGTEGYFQPFTKPVFNVDSASLRITVGRQHRALAYEGQWTVQDHSGSGTLRGKPVFVGYGVVAPAAGWDDYAGVDVKGRIVVFQAYGVPQFLAEKLGAEAMPEPKIDQAYRHGARGVILLNAPPDLMAGSRYSYPARVPLSAGTCPRDMVVAGINDEAAELLFHDAYHSLSSLLGVIGKTKKPASRELPVEVELSAATSFQPAAPMRNVLAKIEGSDPVLKSQYIITGGHYDHLGVTPDGEVLNGANDNASGVAVVMEVARAMRASGYKPKRTIVFAAWDGEEQGLFGSQHYTEHPVFPLERTLVYFNYDCVGQGDPKVYFRGIHFSPELWAAIDNALSPEVRAAIVPTPGSTVGSDHVPFYEHGVQGFAQVTPGDARTGHQPKDKAAFIDAGLLDVNCRLLHETLVLTADNAALTIPPNRLELFRLRAATLVDYHPGTFADLSARAEAVTGFLPLDIAPVRVTGRTVLEMMRALDEIKTAAKAPRKAQVLPWPLSYSGFMDFHYGRYDSRVAVSPGIAFSQLPPDYPPALAIRVLASFGLQWLELGDGDSTSPQLEEVVQACNRHGVLVVLRSAATPAIESVLRVATKPGLLVTTGVPEALAATLGQRQWKVALEWGDGTSPEQYAERLQVLRRAAGAKTALVSAHIPLSGECGPEMVRLMTLLARDSTEDVWGLLGNNLLELLLTLGQ